MYEINKEIPAPEGRSKYPFNKMEVGDSFKCKDRMDFEKARNFSYTYGRRHDVKFMSRREELRIWRIS